MDSCQATFFLFVIEIIPEKNKTQECIICMALGTTGPCNYEV